MKDEGPREYPKDVPEGDETWDRFRELTRRLVNVPRDEVRAEPPLDL